MRQKSITLSCGALAQNLHKGRVLIMSISIYHAKDEYL